MRRFFIAACFIFLITSCYTNSDKSHVEQQNNEKFDSRNERKDAQFIVDAVDASYEILEVAQLGEEKLEDAAGKGIARRIVEGQTSVSVKLKTFAEANGISVPFSGPERTKRSVENLRMLSGEEFQRQWYDEMTNLHQRLETDIEKYRANTDSVMRSALDSTLVMLRENEALFREADVLKE